MLSKEEIKKIKELNKLEKKYEKLYEEVVSIIEKIFEDFEAGDRVGNIVDKKEIPETAQKTKMEVMQYIIKLEKIGEMLQYIFHF